MRHTKCDLGENPVESSTIVLTKRNRLTLSDHILQCFTIHTREDWIILVEKPCLLSLFMNNMVLLRRQQNKFETGQSVGYSCFVFCFFSFIYIVVKP